MLVPVKPRHGPEVTSTPPDGICRTSFVPKAPAYCVDATSMAAVIASLDM
jgi:hypothetical protein